MQTVVNQPTPVEFRNDWSAAVRSHRTYSTRSGRASTTHEPLTTPTARADRPAPGRAARAVRARLARLVPLITIFNLGEPNNYRVPDVAVFRPGPDHVFEPTVELVVEIVSPDDQTWAKLAFYAAHDVNGLLIVDPQQREIH